MYLGHFFKVAMAWKPYGYYIESFLGTYIAYVSWEAQWFSIL
jgi:hypothetical protein